MKSRKLQNAWLLLLQLIVANVCGKPMNIQPDMGSVSGLGSAAIEEGQRQMILIRNNVPLQDLKDYKIVHDPSGEPCLTISWKTNPDGSGPDYPKIYMVDGYFKMLHRPTLKPQ